MLENFEGYRLVFEPLPWLNSMYDECKQLLSAEAWQPIFSDTTYLVVNSLYCLCFMGSNRNEFQRLPTFYMYFCPEFENYLEFLRPAGTAAEINTPIAVEDLEAPRTCNGNVSYNMDPKTPFYMSTHLRIPPESAETDNEGDTPMIY